MDSNIIVAMISLLGTLGGSLGGIVSAATKKYMGKGYCPVYAREALNRIYESYHALGGNGDR